jgi:hypothetical protein
MRDEGGMVGVWERPEDMAGIVKCDALLIPVRGDDLDLMPPHCVPFGIFGRVAKRPRLARRVTDYRVGQLLSSSADQRSGLG